MTDAELDALVKRLGNVCLQTGFPSKTTIDSDVIRQAADAITTLRAETARANRAEAERAAQIESDAVICDELLGKIWDDEAYDCAAAIRAQPHDRTALDRYRETVLREAADKLKGQGYNTAVRQILALIVEATP